MRITSCRWFYISTCCCIIGTWHTTDIVDCCYCCSIINCHHHYRYLSYSVGKKLNSIGMEGLLAPSLLIQVGKHHSSISRGGAGSFFEQCAGIILFTLSFYVPNNIQQPRKVARFMNSTTIQSINSLFWSEEMVCL